MANRKSIPPEKDPESLYNPKFVETYFYRWDRGYRRARQFHNSFMADYAPLWKEESEEVQHLFGIINDMLVDFKRMALHLHDLYRERNQTRKQIETLVKAMKENDLSKRDKILSTIGLEYPDIEFLKFFRQQVEDRI